MNLTDFIIIYLACGAPFGVHFYFQNRAKDNQKNLRLKTIMTVVFWIPFALSIVRRLKNTKWRTVSNLNKTFPGELKFAGKLSALQKRLEKFFMESDSKVSLFEFRQTVERYVGLTLLSNDEAGKTTEREKEIFRAGKSKDVEIAAVCFQRRNRRRLAFHQTRARQDFLQKIEGLSCSIKNTDEFKKSINEFVQLLEDSTARQSIGELFAAKLQTDNPPSVKQAETRVLWKTEIPEPLLMTPISNRIQNLTPMTNLHNKD